jgi:hypothetical protein
VLFISIILIKETSIIKNWNLGSYIFWVRFASVIKFIGIVCGAVVINGTLFGIPWLISAIQGDA